MTWSFAQHYSFLATVLLAVFVTGCVKQESLSEKMQRYAKLPGALESSSGDLVKSVKAIQAQRLDPMSLNRASIRSVDNAYPLLRDALSGKSRLDLYQRADWLFDSEQFLYDAETWEKTAKILSDYAQQIGIILEASDYDACYFPVLHQVGHFDTKDYLDEVRIAVRILLVRAYDQAQAGESSEATKNLCRALTWAHWLSRVRKVEARSAGGQMRTHVFFVAEELFRERLLTAADAEYLYNRLRDFLVNWPSDRRMLVGERSAVLHSYEAIRSGDAKRILTSGEQEQIDRLNRLSEFLEPDSEMLDKDELNYLQAMDLHLEAADDPYYNRREAYKQAISIATDAPNLYAYRIFLIDLNEVEAANARDRSLTEAWCLALAESVGINRPNFEYAPIHGEAYEVISNAVSVEVKIGDSEVHSVTLPRF